MAVAAAAVAPLLFPSTHDGERIGRRGRSAPRATLEQGRGEAGREQAREGAICLTTGGRRHRWQREEGLREAMRAMGMRKGRRVFSPMGGDGEGRCGAVREKSTRDATCTPAGGPQPATVRETNALSGAGHDYAYSYR
jgi:hypothetical protein